MLSALGSLAVPCILCFLFGILMFIVEMFTPGFGVAGGLGIASFAAIIVMQFLANSVTAALIVTAVLVLLLAIIIVLFIRSFQKGTLSRSKIVNTTAVEGESSPVAKEKDLVGKTVVMVNNFAPRKMAGQLSEGMLLCAEDENGVKLLTVDGDVAPGSEIG